MFNSFIPTIPGIARDLDTTGAVIRCASHSPIDGMKQVDVGAPVVSLSV